MKRNLQILISAVLLLTLFLIIKTNTGSSFFAQREIRNSELYSETEIHQAMDTVSRYFVLNFKGCTLQTLEYDDVWQSEQWTEIYDSAKTIVLKSSYRTGSSGEDGSLNPNSTYTNWMWVLSKKDKYSKWELKTCGY